MKRYCYDAEREGIHCEQNGVAEKTLALAYHAAPDVGTWGLSRPPQQTQQSTLCCTHFEGDGIFCSGNDGVGNIRWCPHGYAALFGVSKTRGSRYLRLLNTVKYFAGTSTQRYLWWAVFLSRPKKQDKENASKSSM